MLGGLNWIDGIILLLLAGAIAGSLKIGFLRLTLVIMAFFAALFFGGWLFPRLLPIQDPTWRTILNGNLVLLTAAYAAFKGYDLGRRFHWSLNNTVWKVIEYRLGVVPGLAASLATIWLLSAMIGRLPLVGLSNSVNDALVVQALDYSLPPVPAVFAVFNSRVDPNKLPQLAMNTPPGTSFTPLPAAFESGANHAKNSVVRITGFGCGGVESGTGFVAAKNLVVTPAHVIAGVQRPIVKHTGHSYEAVPVLFDAYLDVAILRVRTEHHTFTAPPLVFAKDGIKKGTTVAIAGYPGGNYTTTPGVLARDVAIEGRNIYGMGTLTRNVLEIQAIVASGSSGSPVVLADGSLAGMIYAKRANTDHYALALASDHLHEKVTQATTSHTRVNPGACLAN